MRPKPLFLLVAALAALPAPCSAALADATQTTVNIIQPVLEVVILSDGLRFGAGRTTEAFYDSDAGLTLQVHDPALDGQVTTGWHVTALATDVTLGSHSISAANVRFHRDTVMFVQDVGGDQAQNQAPVLNSSLPQVLNPLDIPQKIVRAAAQNQSKGTFRLVLPGNAFQLYLPGNTPPGTYRGDLTVTIARGL